MIVKNESKFEKFFIEFIFKVFYLFLFIKFMVHIGWSSELDISTVVILVVALALLVYPVNDELIARTWVLKLLLHIAMITKLCIDIVVAWEYFIIYDIDTWFILFLFGATYYDHLKVKRFKEAI